ncbi:hypothetical protein CROQUDRAFT_92779 [Cronartium quercuum f. sp. fusiforme G11]|uniref:L-ornithine N(5)-monooxygenase [NAD(P)H] n=1 Tax=Cronartium quercuum f. sp. fusiforme G11 TaxID=708437 RepID=A0A9P6NHZ4_9BASI|nr:hypothetical protein CROQUDRAFT_92779 [Cronartium quercuum f. sp. fusiforme G11]
MDSLSDSTDQEPIYDILGIGFGPANLAISVALAEVNLSRGVNGDELLTCYFLEAQDEFRWHPGMMINGSRMQISFLKDLATFRNPGSPFTFINYLHHHHRLASFVNRSTFTPTRLEFSDYLKWVSNQVINSPKHPTGINVCYDQRVTSVEIKKNQSNGDIDYLIIKSISKDFKNIQERKCRNLIISTGGTPSIPNPFDQLYPHQRLIHTSEYLKKVDQVLIELKTQQLVSQFKMITATTTTSSEINSIRSGSSSPLLVTPDQDLINSNINVKLKIGVIGGGQSATETLLETYNKLNKLNIETELDLIIRRNHLHPSDDSPFANEIFDPKSTDFFFKLGNDSNGIKNGRELILDESKSTNYGVVNPETLKMLYETIYAQKVEEQTQSSITGIQNQDHSKINIINHSIITQVDESLNVIIENVITHETFKKSYDLLILGTGYNRQSWKDILFGNSSTFSEIFSNQNSSPDSITTTTIDGSTSSINSNDEIISDFNFNISRNYKLLLPNKLEDKLTGLEFNFRPTIWLQGCNELTHGISDSLLSVLAVRSGEVIDGIQNEGWFGGHQTEEIFK